jgi:protein-tyrosine-phosphatase
MAAGLAERIADRFGLNVLTRSAGTLGLLDKPAHPNAVLVCREVGVDLSTHRSRGLDDDLLAWADKIVVMELEHATHIRAYFERHADKVVQLGPYAGVEDIPDPHRSWVCIYRRCRRTLEAGIEKLLRALA